MAYIAPVSRGENPSSHGISETRDCTVRALANALEIEYPEAHKATMKYRTKNRGMTIENVIECYKRNGAISTEFYGAKTVIWAKYRKISGVFHDKSMTIKSFMEANPFGKFIVIVRGHATVVENGQLVDTGRMKAGTRILAVFKFYVD
jgi:hypothetical protein